MTNCRISQQTSGSHRHALRGKEFIEFDNPYDVGMNRASRILIRLRPPYEYEVLLMIGTDLSISGVLSQRRDHSYKSTFGRTVRTPDPGWTLVLLGTRRPLWRALLPSWNRTKHQQHLKDSLEHYRKARKGLE